MSLAKSVVAILLCCVMALPGFAQTPESTGGNHGFFNWLSNNYTAHSTPTVRFEDSPRMEKLMRAGMLGTQEFNSACFYRYANIDLKQLDHNLQGDKELALSGIRAFLESFIMAIPKAKQNSTAAQSLPSFVMLVVRDKGLASLANAFARPVDGRNKGLMVNSVEALAHYWGKLMEMYGSNGITSALYATIEDAGLDALNSNAAQKRDNVKDLLDRTMSVLGGGK